MESTMDDFATIAERNVHNTRNKVHGRDKTVAFNLIVQMISIVTRCQRKWKTLVGMQVGVHLPIPKCSAVRTEAPGSDPLFDVQLALRQTLVGHSSVFRSA